MEAVLRPCKVCGMFYPAVRRELEREIGTLLQCIHRRTFTGKIRGIVAPHAGYKYSGRTAAHAYALLDRCRYEAVVIVAPSHSEYFDGVSVFSGDGYMTPMGKVAIHRELREEILRVSPLVQSSGAGHGNEHAIEVQLPFIQYVLGKFTFLPIIIGDQRRENCLELGRALSEILQGKDVLLVASTDLSHYHSYDDAVKLDRIMTDDISLLDSDCLMMHLASGETEACGGGPTIAVISALKSLGVSSMEIMHQCNSGDITGDHSRVVGYVSAVGFS